MATLLRVEGLYGGYVFNKPVLHNLSFSVESGEIVGLIGLNGAGKSTAIKHVIGLLAPQRGHISIRNRTLADAPEVYRSSFAFVPETPELYEELTVAEHFRLTAMAYGLEPNVFAARLDELVDLFGLRGKLNSLPAHLSKGMRQKVMIMNAFLVEPPLYIVDEPFVGLDPLAIRSLLELMVRFRKAGAGFLLCSHVLSTLEKYCDRLIVLHEGRIVVQGTLPEIRKFSGQPGASLDDVFYAIVGERLHD